MNQLTKNIMDAVDGEVEGSIHSISLPSFLQLIEMENKTCTLTITPDNGSQSGKLYFVEGELFGAEVGDLENEEAAYRIIGWEKASILIHRTCRITEQKIAQPLMKILMEGQRLKDENSGDPPDADVPPAENKQQSPSPEAHELMEKLSTESSIRVYDLYDEADRPIPSGPAGPAAAHSFGPPAPSKYFHPGGLPGSAEADGKSRYIVVHTESGAQVVLFQYHHVTAVVSLKSGHTPYAFIQTIRARLAHPEKQTPARHGRP